MTKMPIIYKNGKAVNKTLIIDVVEVMKKKKISSNLRSKHIACLLSGISGSL